MSPRSLQNLIKMTLKFYLKNRQNRKILKKYAARRHLPQQILQYDKQCGCKPITAEPWGGMARFSKQQEYEST